MSSLDLYWDQGVAYGLFVTFWLRALCGLLVLLSLNAHTIQELKQAVILQGNITFSVRIEKKKKAMIRLHTIIYHFSGILLRLYLKCLIINTNLIDNYFISLQMELSCVACWWVMMLNWSPHQWYHINPMISHIFLKYFLKNVFRLQMCSNLHFCYNTYMG